MGALANDLHELFANEYLIDLNATQAYIRANNNECEYNTAKAYAYKLLQDITVRTRVRELMDERSKDTLIDAKYVVDGLNEVYLRAMQAKPVLEWDYEAKEFKETGEYQFDSHGANKALELLGKHVAMFTDKTEVKNTGGIKVITGKDIDEPTDGLSVTVNDA